MAILDISFIVSTDALIPKHRIFYCRMMGLSWRSLCARKISRPLCHVMRMDVAWSKKWPKMQKKHEKHLRHINVFPKGVRSKSSSTDATRSKQSDSRSPWECTSDFMADPPGNECIHMLVDDRCNECNFYV